MVLALLAGVVGAHEAHGGSPPPDLGAGLIARYPFDGDANDASGNGHHGTLNGGATLAPDRFGNPMSALSLDGLDDFVQVPHHPDLNINPTGFTVALWVKASPNQLSFDSLFILIAKSHGRGGSTDWAVQGAADPPDPPPGGLGFLFCNAGAPDCGPGRHSSAGVSPAARVLDDQWHCVVGTFDPPTMNFFLDGRLEGSAAATGSPGVNEDELFMGRWWAGSRHFHGLMDDVRLYRRALTMAEVGSFCQRARVAQHFQSYDLDQPERVGETVVLVDQFGSRTVRLEEIEWLINPVEKRRAGMEPEPIQRPDEHLTCYGFAVSLFTERTVQVRNQFVGDSTLRIGRPLTLCTPAAKTREGPPGEPPTDLDHFQCYDVRSESPRFTSETLTLSDQFGTLTARIDRARELCNPVEKRRAGREPEPIKRPEEHLVCYRIVSHTPAFSALDVLTRDQFGTDTLRVVSPRRLCVPSEKIDGVLTG